MSDKEYRQENVFTVRNYRLVFFGALISELGSVLYSFAVSFYILEITGNNAFLQGLYLALCGITQLLLTPVGGVLGDRFNKAKIMSLCDYLKGIMILAATALLLVFSEKDAHMIVLFVTGIAGNAVSGIFNPASGALLPYIVKEGQLQQANAYFSVKSALQSILGIVLAGVLYAALPVHLLFFLVGLCYVLSGVSEMFIRYDHQLKEGELNVRTALSDMKEGIVYLRGQKAIMAIIASALFINFFFTPLTGNFIPYFVRTDIANSPAYLLSDVLTPEQWYSVFGVLVGLFSLLGSVILSVRAQEDKCGHKIALRLCATAGIMIVLTGGYWFFVSRGVSLNAFIVLFSLGCVLIGIYLSLVNIPINTVLMRVVEKDKLSKVTSILSVISGGLTPISSVAAGALIQLFGSAVLLAVCSTGFTLTALALLFNKDVREI